MERPGTVFFDYLPVCEREPRNRSRCIEVDPFEISNRPRPLTFKITDGTHIQNAMVNALHHNGFRHTTSSGYNLFWGGSRSTDFLRDFDPYQKARHFPGCWQLGRKDNLWRNMSRMKR